MMAQLTTDYKGNDFTGTLTGANLDLINGSGTIHVKPVHFITL